MVCTTTQRRVPRPEPWPTPRRAMGVMPRVRSSRRLPPAGPLPRLTPQQIMDRLVGAVITPQCEVVVGGGLRRQVRPLITGQVTRIRRTLTHDQPNAAGTLPVTTTAHIHTSSTTTRDESYRTTLKASPDLARTRSLPPTHAGPVQPRRRLLPLPLPPGVPLANQVPHPRNVYLRGDALTDPLDTWPASAFAPHRIAHTITAMADAQPLNHPPSTPAPTRPWSPPGSRRPKPNAPARKPNYASSRAPPRAG